MKKILKNNGLSIVFFFFFIITLFGQTVTGVKEYNKELLEKGLKPVPISQYFISGHFIEATFENWESEFLQMGMFVVFTIFLYQKGSSESKDPDEGQPGEKTSINTKNAPWGVKKGGLFSQFYKHSLSIALFLLFVFSFLFHWYGSLKDYNEHQIYKGKSITTAIEYLTNSKLWFESFQNWQSEYLSIFAMVVLTIYLRDKGSPQSKPLDAPNSQTGI